MTDKEKIRKEIERLQKELIQEKEKGFGSDIDDACILELQNVLTYIDSLQEEPKFKTGDRIKPVDSCLGSPRTIVDICNSWYVTDQGTLDFEYEDNWEAVEEPVSESLNTESMIESYKQRLISQVNGIKNSPLIDMCLTSYKHGINEILDTLNLSNVQRAVKNCEDPVSEDLEEASKKWLIPKLDKTYAIYGEAKMMELTRFDGYAMLDAIEFGAKWGRNQAMAKIQAQSMALAHGCPKESVSDEEEKACWKAREKYDAKISFSKYMFKAGANWQKQQDAKILESVITNGKDYSTLDSFLNTFKMMQYGKIKM